jgi:hypothetical protein
MATMGILARIALAITTPTSARDIQRVDDSFDISAAPEFFDRTITLEANNDLLNNPRSETVINTIQFFVHLQFSSKATLSLNGGTPIIVDRIFLAAAQFTTISIKNEDRTQARSLFIKAIYA